MAAIAWPRGGCDDDGASRTWAGVATPKFTAFYRTGGIGDTDF